MSGYMQKLDLLEADDGWLLFSKPIKPVACIGSHRFDHSPRLGGSPPNFFFSERKPLPWAILESPTKIVKSTTCPHQMDQLYQYLVVDISIIFLSTYLSTLYWLIMFGWSISTTSFWGWSSSSFISLSLGSFSCFCFVVVFFCFEIHCAVFHYQNARYEYFICEHRLASTCDVRLESDLKSWYYRS